MIGILSERALNMPVGRPTKYNESMVATAEAYYERTLSILNDMPTMEELALELGVDGDTLVEWAKEKPEFSAAIKRVKELQKQKLQTMGLFNRVNPTMAIFLLKTNHGFIDTSRQEVSGRDGGPVEASTTVTFMPKQLPPDYWKPETVDNGSNNI